MKTAFARSSKPTVVISRTTAPKPDASYAIVAGVLRSRGLEVNDNDFDLIDAMINFVDHLLDLRSFVQR